jgi:hypothetical protein
MVSQTQEIMTVIPEDGKPDPRLPAHPGWFHRCRHTGELEWVPASAAPDRTRPTSAARR